MLQWFKFLSNYSITFGSLTHCTCKYNGSCLSWVFAEECLIQNRKFTSLPNTIREIVPRNANLLPHPVTSELQIVQSNFGASCPPDVEFQISPITRVLIAAPLKVPFQLRKKRAREKNHPPGTAPSSSLPTNPFRRLLLLILLGLVPTCSQILARNPVKSRMLSNIQSYGYSSRPCPENHQRCPAMWHFSNASSRDYS